MDMSNRSRPYHISFLEKILLRLASNNFYFEQYKGNLRIICLGKGNGLGLSQYGADQMAKQGKTYQKILKYYYPKTMIQKLYE